LYLINILVFNFELFSFKFCYIGGGGGQKVISVEYSQSVLVCKEKKDLILTKLPTFELSMLLKKKMMA
jgi:hypothetical protein